MPASQAGSLQNSQVSANTEKSGFFNIGHMTNTPDAIDYVIENGANGVEVDLHFTGLACDCSYKGA